MTIGLQTAEELDDTNRTADNVGHSLLAVLEGRAPNGAVEILLII